jgi:3-oxoacyl-[acyl-carrier protein] reductase
MDLGIAGKRVLVTAGSQGLGRAAALAFAGEGCRVAVVSRNQEKLDALVTEMGGQERGHIALGADLMQPGETERVIRALTSTGEGFDIVIHNIGGTLGLKNPLADSEQWAQVWRFNVGIAIEINNLVIPAMVEQGGGRIIHISSTAAETVHGSTPYAAAKAFLNTYVKGLGRKFAPTGLVISAVMPGAFEAEGGHWEKVRLGNPALLDDFLRHHQAIGRLGTPEEITAFLLFMASRQATFSTAGILAVDGGGS